MKTEAEQLTMFEDTSTADPEDFNSEEGEEIDEAEGDDAGGEAEWKEVPLRDNYKGFTSKNLKDAPNQVLHELLLMCHPDDTRWPHDTDPVKLARGDSGYKKREEAYDIGRGEVLSEISARGARIMEELGYPTKLKTKYVNIHTGSLEEYGDMTSRATSCERFHNDRQENWSILEHWLPLEMLGEDNDLHLRYLKGELAQAEAAAKSSKEAYYKSQVKKCKQDIAEEEIRLSRIKAGQKV